jgi:hypothetical protein
LLDKISVMARRAVHHDESTFRVTRDSAQKNNRTGNDLTCMRSQDPKNQSGRAIARMRAKKIFGESAASLR